MQTLLLFALVLLIIGGYFNIFPVVAGSAFIFQRAVGVLSIVTAVYLFVRLVKPSK